MGNPQHRGPRAAHAAGGAPADGRAKRGVWVAALMAAALQVTPCASQTGLPPEAAAAFEQGVRLFRSGNYGEALAAIEPLGDRHPRMAEIQHLLGILLDLNQRPEEASESFRRAVSLRPGSADFRSNFGTSLMRLGRASEAADQFRRVLESQPRHPTASFNLGTILLQAGRPEEALPHLKTAHELQPSVFENAYQLAYCQLVLGRHEEADGILASLADEAAASAEVRLLQALADRALGRTDRTAQALQAIQPALAGRPQLQFQAALLLRGQGLLHSAEELLLAAAQHLPASYPVLFQLSVTRRQLGKLPAAVDAARRALGVKATAEAHLLLGELLEAQGHPLEAVRHLQAALAIDPSPQHYFALGYEFLAHWNWEAAARVFEEGLAAHRDAWNLWVGAGAAALGRARHDEATRAFLNAVRLRPRDLEGYRLVAQAFEQSDEAFEDAVACFRRLLELEPRDPWARYLEALATVREMARSGSGGDASARLQALQDLTREDSAFLEAQLLLGEVQFDLRDWAASTAALERAVELAPSHARAHYRLGLTLQRSGQTERARRVLQRYQDLKAREDRSVGERVAATTRFIVELEEDLRRR